jgi:hypothetical protein
LFDAMKRKAKIQLSGKAVEAIENNPIDLLPEYESLIDTLSGDPEVKKKIKAGLHSLSFDLVGSERIIEGYRRTICELEADLAKTKKVLDESNRDYVKQGEELMETSRKCKSTEQTLNIYIAEVALLKGQLEASQKAMA